MYLEGRQANQENVYFSFSSKTVLISTITQQPVDVHLWNEKKNHLTILTIQAKYGRVQILTTRYTF